MTDLTLKAVRAAVIATRQLYLSRRFTFGAASMSLFELNNGLCEDFAEHVVTLLGYNHNDLDGENLEIVQCGNFQTDHDGDPKWDRRLLADHWGIASPGALTWDQADKVDFGVHLWVAARVGPGATWLHFDAECPDGVASFFDLPLVRRYLHAAWPTEADVRKAPADHVF